MAGAGWRWGRYAVWGLAGLGLAAGIVLVVWRVPPALYSYVPDPKDRAAAEASTRTGLIAGLAGLGALGSLAVAIRTYRLTQEGQVTDRYTKAIEQLGSDNLDITLGGLYALERIAKDSPLDRATIVEVLIAYVRGHSPWPPARPEQYVEVEDALLDQLPSLQRRCPDVQAAMTVLGRMPPDDRIRLDLQGCDLRKVRLPLAYLKGAVLPEVHLERAVLVGAHLEGAMLLGVHLEGADLSPAYLERALLADAHLKGANLAGADLKGVDLSGAHLEGAILDEAYLKGANLSSAYLEGTWANKKTKWPDAVDWKAAGVVMEENEPRG